MYREWPWTCVLCCGAELRSPPLRRWPWGHVNAFHGRVVFTHDLCSGAHGFKSCLADQISRPRALHANIGVLPLRRSELLPSTPFPNHSSPRVYFSTLSSPVGWGTALQTGRSRFRFQMVSLEFFIHIILPAALWNWGRLSLQQKWIPGISPVGKGARYLGLKTLPPSYDDCHEIWEPQPPGALRACPWIALLLTGVYFSSWSQ